MAHISENTALPASSRNETLLIETRSAYEDAIGKEGVARSDFETLAPELERVQARVTERRRGGLDADYACLNLHEMDGAAIADIESQATRLRQFADLIVIGIGGSNLGAMAVEQALSTGGRKNTGSRLHYVDNIDPDGLHDLVASLQPAATGVVAISKSGGTIETVTEYLVIRDWLERALGRDAARAHQS